MKKWCGTTSVARYAKIHGIFIHDKGTLGDDSISYHVSSQSVQILLFWNPTEAHKPILKCIQPVSSAHVHAWTLFPGSCVWQCAVLITSVHSTCPECSQGCQNCSWVWEEAEMGVVFYRNWTQGHIHIRQTLYYWTNCTPSPFHFILIIYFYFWDRVSLSLCRLTSNLLSSCFSLPSSWDYRLLFLFMK